MRRSTAVTAAALCFVASSAFADEAALRAEVERLREEVAGLQQAVRELQAQRVASSPSPPPVSAREAGSTNTAPASSIPTNAATSLWGYGEIDYNHPNGRAADAQADLRRAVLGFSHAFDESTRVYGELEWEHAVVSATDQGESAIEQLFVEHALGPNYGLRAGLLLVPLGLLNEHHEPTHYYGVERNFVETAIIPTTWREGGVAAYGESDDGWRWNLGIGTGPDLGKWDPTSSEGRASPLGSIHQELQLAKAHDPSLYGALNWDGIPGLNLGGGVFTGKIGQANRDLPIDRSRLILGEVHARWQVGPIDLSGLYTRATIRDTQAFNLTLLGQPTPVPQSFWGGYVQGAWHALTWNDSSLVPFLRLEAFNTAASYAPQPPGFGTAPLPTQRVWTIGANYYLHPNVVFKIDYQDFRYDDATLNYGNRFDLGIGYQF